MRKFIVLFLLVIAIIFGGVFFWRFLSHGTVQISGEAPFRVTVKGVRTISCAKSPCAVKLKSGTYTFITEKTGFLPDIQTISVSKRERVSAALSFRAQPLIQKIGSYVTYELPDTITTNLDTLAFPLETVSGGQLLGIPKGAQKLIFSPQGNFAFGETKRGQFFYDVRNAEATAFSDVSFVAAGWKEDESGFFYLSSPKPLIKQGLYAWNRETGESTLSAVFPRALQRADIFVSPEASHVAVLDLDEKRLYVVSLAEKKRTVLVTDPLLSDVAWRGNDFLAITVADATGKPSVKLFHMDGTEIVTPIRTELSKTVWNGDRLIFATQQTFTIQEPKEALLMQLSIEMRDKTLFGEFDPKSGTLLFLAEPAEAISVERFGVSTKTAAHFLSDGAVYQLVTGRP